MRIVKLQPDNKLLADYAVKFKKKLSRSPVFALINNDHFLVLNIYDPFESGFCNKMN